MMDEKELALIEKNEKISTRRALRELGYGSVGITFTIGNYVENSGTSTFLSVVSLNVEIKKEAIQDEVKWVKSLETNEPAFYPRSWLYAKIEEQILKTVKISHENIVKDVKDRSKSYGN